MPRARSKDIDWLRRRLAENLAAGAIRRIQELLQHDDIVLDGVETPVGEIGLLLGAASDSP